MAITQFYEEVENEVKRDLAERIKEEWDSVEEPLNADELEDSVGRAIVDSLVATVRELADGVLDKVNWELEVSKMRMPHSQDEHCFVVEGECSVCHVWHGDPCPECDGRGFHEKGCKQL